MAETSPNLSEENVPARSLKQGTPTDDELEELAGCLVAEEWKKLGRRLKIKDSKLDEIHEAHGQLSEKGYYMLKHWKQGNSTGATYQALSGALEHKLVLRQDLATQFCYTNDETFAIQLPGGSAPVATTRTCDSGTLSRDPEDSSGEISGLKRKRLEPNPERGYLSLKTECASATSRNAEEQDPQPARKKVNRYMEEKVDEAKGKFDLSSFTGLRDMYVYLVGELYLVDINFNKSSIKITVKCRTLEILDRLWDDYCSGHLNEVAEMCLITEKVKDELDMEAITLTTTILEEDYLACRLSLMETAGEYSSSPTSSKKRDGDPYMYAQKPSTVMAHSAAHDASPVGVSGGVTLNRFLEFLERLSLEIEEDQLDALKFLLQAKIPLGILEKCQTPRQLFSRMMQMSLLGENNLDDLEQLFEEAQRFDLAERVRIFKQSCVEMDCELPDKAFYHNDKKLDLILVVDCAISNPALLGRLKTQLCHLVNTIFNKGFHLRLALISYYNHQNTSRFGMRSGNPLVNKTVFTENFIDDKKEMKHCISNLRCFGERGTTNGLADGLASALHLSKAGQNDAMKICILLPMMDQRATLEIFKCEHGHDVMKLCRQLSSNAVTLYTVAVAKSQPVPSYLPDPALALMADFFTGISLKTGGQFIQIRTVKLISEVVMYIIDEDVTMEYLFGTAYDIIFEEIKTQGNGDVDLEHLTNVLEHALNQRFCQVSLILLDRLTIEPKSQLAKKFSLDEDIDSACTTFQCALEKLRQSKNVTAPGTPVDGDKEIKETGTRSPQVSISPGHRITTGISERIVRKISLRQVHSWLKRQLSYILQERKFFKS